MWDREGWRWRVFEKEGGKRGMKRFYVEGKDECTKWFLNFLPFSQQMSGG